MDKLTNSNKSENILVITNYDSIKNAIRVKKMNKKYANSGITHLRKMINQDNINYLVNCNSYIN